MYWALLKKWKHLNMRKAPNVNSDMDDEMKKKNKKRIVRLIVSAICFPFLCLIKVILSKYSMFEDYILGCLFETMNRIFYQNSIDNQLLYYRYNKATKITPQYNDSGIGVVLQGPIEHKNDFTVNTLKFYRKVYPKIELVLSTWEGDLTSVEKEALKKIDVKIIQNITPKYAGWGHINYQLLSSREGVRYLKNKGCKYVLKSRTDQIIRRCDFLKYFKLYVENIKPDDDKLNKRIVFLGCEFSHKYFPFHLCDYMTFGDVNDVFKMYDIPLQKDGLKYVKHQGLIEKIRKKIGKYELLDNVEDNIIFKKWMRVCEMHKTSEVYITKSFYDIYLDDGKYDDEMMKYQDFIKKYTIIIDDTEIMLYWPKYLRRMYQEKNYYSKTGSMDHIYWMRLLNEYKRV